MASPWLHVHDRLTRPRQAFPLHLPHFMPSFLSLASFSFTSSCVSLLFPCFISSNLYSPPLSSSVRGIFLSSSSSSSQFPVNIHLAFSLWSHMWNHHLRHSAQCSGFLSQYCDKNVCVHVHVSCTHPTLASLYELAGTCLSLRTAVCNSFRQRPEMNCGLHM